MSGSVKPSRKPSLPAGAWYALMAFFAVGFIISPFLYTVGQAVHAGEGTTLDVFRQFFTSENHLSVARNTLLLGLSTTLVCGTLGTVLALYMTFLAGRFKKVLHVLLLSPMMIPGVITVLAFIELYGESGLVNKGLQTVLGLSGVPIHFEGFGAILFVIAYTQYVFFYLNVFVSLKYLDYAQIEAARSLGAGTMRIFRTIVLPTITPALITSAIITFASGASSFSAPNIIGGFKVLSTQIVRSKASYNMDMASVQAVVLFAICVTMLLFLRLIGSRLEASQTDRSTSHAAPSAGRAPFAIVCRIVVAFQIVLILLPIAAIVYLSFNDTGAIMQQVFPHQFTLDNYSTIFQKPRVLQPLLNSLKMACITVVAGLAITVPSAYFIVRRRTKPSVVLRFLLTLPAAMPASLTAVNLINAFNEPNAFAFNQALVGGFWILPIAYTIVALPMLLSSNELAIQGVHGSLEEASASLGAGAAQTFARIILPNTVPGIMAGGVLILIRTIGEYTMSALLYGVYNRPISISIITNMQEYQTGVSLAYGVIVIAVCYLALALIFRLDKDRYA